MAEIQVTAEVAHRGRNARELVSSRYVSGVSMIELMVAVLVMGIGVLGSTALQMVSLQNNHSALYRAEAVQMAYDVLDRIRTNPSGQAVAGQAYDGLVMDSPPLPISANCHTANCNQAQMVSYDLAVWKCSLGAHNELPVCADLRGNGALPADDRQPGLPAGDGSIVVDPVSGVITVVVSWRGPRGVLHDITVESQG